MRAMNWILRRSATSKHHQRRALHVESLHSRIVFAADAAAAPVDDGAANVEIVDTMDTSFDTASDASTGSDPAAIDAVMGTYGTSEAAPTGEPVAESPSDPVSEPADPPGGPSQYAPPLIDDFDYREEGGIYTFYGHVDYIFPGQLEIEFGGLLQGYVIPVEPDGTFEFITTVPAGKQGVVSAIAYPPEGPGSNYVEVFVY